MRATRSSGPCPSIRFGDGHQRFGDPGGVCPYSDSQGVAPVLSWIALQFCQGFWAHMSRVNLHHALGVGCPDHQPEPCGPDGSTCLQAQDPFTARGETAERCCCREAIPRVYLRTPVSRFSRLYQSTCSWRPEHISAFERWGTRGRWRRSGRS